MHNKVVFQAAKALDSLGIAVLRFNFRGVGTSQGEHAHLEGEIEDAKTLAGLLLYLHRVEAGNAHKVG